MAQAVQGKPPNRAPHIRLGVPMNVLTRSVDAAFDRMKPASLEMQGLGELKRYVDTKMSVSPRKIQVALDRDDAAKINLDFDIKTGNRALFGMELLARAPITYSPEKGKMRFSIRADLFEKVKPRLDEDAVAKLTDHLLGQLPTIARGLIPRSEVTALARKAVEYLGEKAYDLLREQVLSGVGELTSFSVDFPDIPLAGLSLTNVGGADGFLRLDARLDLPVVQGLADDDSELASAMQQISRGKTPEESDQLEIAVATEAVMALANWGIAKGKLPGRYGEAGKAEVGGKYRVGAAWQAGERPLKVNLWSLDTPGLCMHALAGAQPAIEWEKGHLKVGLTESRIEALSGPPWLQLVAQLTPITQGMFDFTKTLTTQTEVGVGGEGWKLGLKNVRLDGQVFRVRMSTSVKKKGS